jgi:hypothetical protein
MGWAYKICQFCAKKCAWVEGFAVAWQNLAAPMQRPFNQTPRHFSCSHAAHFIAPYGPGLCLALNVIQICATFQALIKEIIMDKAITLSFRTETAFAEATALLAKFKGQNRSAYIEQAIREKNERTMAERIAFLSQALAAQSLATSEALDGTLEDGLV